MVGRTPPQRQTHNTVVQSVCVSLGKKEKG
jgi:hypothetical protein